MFPVKIVVLAVLVGGGFWLALVAAILSHDWPGLLLNLGTEIMGAVAIYLILNQFIEGRERREAEGRKAEQYKSDVIRRMGSAVHDVAIEAAEEAKAHGWLYDGSLQGAYLVGADLRGALLIGADLERAYLVSADLRGAFLSCANLRGARLKAACFDDGTRLPDGTNWMPGTDMARFTDPQHPDFWRSDYLLSPAYQPKEQE